jgi:hypothetical protein
MPRRVSHTSAFCRIEEIRFFNRLSSLIQIFTVDVTALARGSGGPGVLLAEKNEDKKSRDAVPLNSF